jgi:hypothetical protein
MPSPAAMKTREWSTVPDIGNLVVRVPSEFQGTRWFVHGHIDHLALGLGFTLKPNNPICDIEGVNFQTAVVAAPAVGS